MYFPCNTWDTLKQKQTNKQTHIQTRKNPENDLLTLKIFTKNCLFFIRNSNIIGNPPFYLISFM